MFPFGETVTVTRKGGVATGQDSIGNPILSAPETFDVGDVGVAPLTPQEATELWGEGSKGGYTLYMPFGTALTLTDLVAVRGEAGFQVQGDASAVQWRSPLTGWEPGSVAIVRRAS